MGITAKNVLLIPPSSATPERALSFLFFISDRVLSQGVNRSIRNATVQFTLISNLYHICREE